MQLFCYLLLHNNNISMGYPGLVQEKHKSIANSLELRFSCTDPSICSPSWAEWLWESIEIYIPLFINITIIQVVQIFPDEEGLLGTDLISYKTSYRKILIRLETVKLGVRTLQLLWNLAGILEAVLPRHLVNFKVIWAF